MRQVIGIIVTIDEVKSIKPYILHVLGHPVSVRTDATTPQPVQAAAFAEVSVVL